MARAARLLELLIRLRSSPRLTAADLAKSFEVSRRTMLRDLEVLAGLGVPIVARPGRGGGFVLDRDHGIAPIALTVDEALGVLLAYEAFSPITQSPFAADELSAISKLRASLPRDIAQQLERVRRHVAVFAPPVTPAPLLRPLLDAALDGVHLRVRYRSRSGTRHRVIFPYGVYTADGCWYCACHDDARGPISLRVDRVLAVDRVERADRPPAIAVADWYTTVERDDGSGLAVRILVRPPGQTSLNLATLFGPIPPSGIITATIPRREVAWFAAQLLQEGTDIVVEEPPELIEAMRRQARAIVDQYPPSAR